MKTATAWVPSMVLGVAAVLTVGVDSQREMPLQAPLGAALPQNIAGLSGRDLPLPDDVVQATGVSDYLMRGYQETDTTLSAGSFLLYIGYYEEQMRGKTIHSPRNCMPGAGWHPLAATESRIPSAMGPMIVNRYLLQKDEQQVLVLYWYQGRGRVRASEYFVKWDLLKDAALHKRTEEALVRIVVPVIDDVGEAFSLASRVAGVVAPALDAALPAWN